MIGQLQVLLRVKELKQEQAFRAMRSKRQEVEDAKVATEGAQRQVRESAATLPAREDAIYAEVLGCVIDIDDIDETRGKVVSLEKEHQLLKDKAERALHVQKRLEDELEVLTARYRQFIKVRDKYVIITDEMKREIDEIADSKEEAEVEDLFSRPKRRLG